MASPDRKYRLNYGNSLLATPNYDTAALQTALASNSIPLTATLGDQQSQNISDVRSLSEQWLSNPWLIGGIIVGLVVLLGAVLRQAAQRLEDIPRS